MNMGRKEMKYKKKKKKKKKKRSTIENHGNYTYRGDMIIIGKTTFKRKVCYWGIFGIVNASVKQIHLDWNPKMKTVNYNLGS